jgi:hypothetical protein
MMMILPPGFSLTQITHGIMKKLCMPRVFRSWIGLSLIIVAFMLVGTMHVSAQAPYQFSYQGVARDATGKVVANSNITVRISIHKDSPGGNVTFTETQIVQTNSIGIFTLIIGGLNGALDNVKWGSDNCFMQTEIDITGGANFIDLGTTSLKSVPYALASRSWINNVPVVQTGVVGAGPSLPTPLAGANLIWHPKNAAFRVGHYSDVTLLEDSEIGISSFGAGLNAVATGESSVALGHGLYAKSKGSVALGMYNNDLDTKGAPLLTDRIFQIGNGVAAARSNALTILRNGKVGIGNNVLTPQYILDIGGRSRLRHNGETAGLYFNNSQNNPEGFVGMVHDNAIGLYIADAWRLVVGSDGVVSASSFFSTSDKRLKTNIRPLGSCLPNIMRLQGYTYNWKDPKNSTKLQTGLIAQEVEVFFPNLVNTDKDGFKAVNYTGLIPHLIEAVKELDQKTSEIAELKKELAEVKQLNKRMTEMEASLKTLLTGNTSAIGKPHTK